MQEGIKDTLVFDMKDLRHEDFKEYEALVPPASLSLNYEEAEFIKTAVMYSPTVSPRRRQCLCDSRY